MGDRAIMRLVCESLCGDVMRIAELVLGELKLPTRPQTSDDPVARLRTFEELSRARDSIYDAKAKIEKALAALEPRYMPHQPLSRAAYERAMRVAEAAIEQSPKAPVIAFDQPPNSDEP
jgi:hypothetical protein